MNAEPATRSVKPSIEPRLAIVVSHPIQYYAPYYRALAADGRLQLKAFFCSRIGVDDLLDPDMGIKLSWRTDLMSGYGHEFLPKAGRITTTRFREVDNPSIARYLAGFRPDVVLLHGYAQMTLLRALFWCRRHGVPTMMISDRSFAGSSTILRKIARRLVLPTILRKFTAFLVIGDAVHEFCTSFGARDEQIFRVPNMLDQGFWKLRDHKAEVRIQVRAELEIGKDFLVLFVGKLVARKRPQDLLAALASLRNRGPTNRPIRVFFAGDGEMRSELEKRAIAANLPAHFLGFVNIDELPKYYAIADVLAHPAEFESYGIITLEAALFGLPLVLSDRVGAIGPTSIARPGENTLVHPCADVEALAEALAQLAEDQSLTKRMSEASLRISQEHDGRKAVDNTLAAVNYCLHVSGRSGSTATG